MEPLPPSDRMGINFINSAQHEPDGARYEAAALTGAGWDRWPVYWSSVEVEPDVFEWGEYDRLVSEEIERGINIEAILMVAPRFYSVSGITLPTGTREPIFSDGTDEPGPDKEINPENRWAVFVSRAVERYMPGGILAEREGWPDGAGIRVWEVWNEPDLFQYWADTVGAYARLLRVAYIVTHWLDPDATIMIGGLATRPGDTSDWFRTLLIFLASDPNRDRFNWYFDAVGVHSYFDIRDTRDSIAYVQRALAYYGLDKPIWLNENGVAVWDDYPGPFWTRQGTYPMHYKATQEEQAAYIIQTATYSFALGADVFFYFQLYDDCGDSPAGTDFPLHEGELCEELDPCWGNAYGLFRNPENSLCFTHHPEPGTPRPALRAYRLISRLFGHVEFEVLSADDDPRAQVARFAFYRPDTSQRVLVMWNQTGGEVTIDVPTIGSTAELIDMYGESVTIHGENGAYTITLEPATNLNNPDHPGRYAIGGPPLILIERVPPTVLQ